MAINPSLQKEATDSPIERANQLNDPQFENSQGYFPYDLTHQEVMTPLFGLGTPSMCVHTIPGDRVVLQDNAKVVLNQIDGNFLNQLNMYKDCFFVPLRSVFPINYEKLMTNPTKGQDIPNSALPQVPFNKFVFDFIYGDQNQVVQSSGDQFDISSTIKSLYIDYLTLIPDYPLEENQSRSMVADFFISRMTMLATILSRGQLLDYLGYCIDDGRSSSLLRPTNSVFQEHIDDFFNKLADYALEGVTAQTPGYINYSEPDLRNSVYEVDNWDRTLSFTDKPTFRQALNDILEKGAYFQFVDRHIESNIGVSLINALIELHTDIVNIFIPIDDIDYSNYVTSINVVSNPFQVSHISLTPLLAYQQVIAQYYTNDRVDNIFNSQLYMQALRAVMYPSILDFSSEPTFTFNGVSTEYDYISAGGFYYSLLYNPTGVNNGVTGRQYVFASMLFLLRRTLRYGDKFTTSRPNMLAVGDLSIPVENGMVSPIDVTQNLLKQRYLNAANYLGSGFLKQFEGIHGVRPSDTDTFPRFVGHRLTKLQNQLTNNTADEQGKQTTNIAGYVGDELAYDIFVDDFGILIDIVSFDTMPIYTSGIDATFHLSDRFDYFNPMLQNIGDQPLFASELFGDPSYRNRIFGYHMRNSEYKYKVSKAHGALVNDLPSFLMKYPVNKFLSADTLAHIDPEFIRDKPVYLDPVIPDRTGVSPAQYYHFIVDVTNVVQTARKMQAQPPVLF